MLEASPAGVAMSDIGSVLVKMQTLADSMTPVERQIVTDLLSAAGLAPTMPPQYNPFLPGVHADPYRHYAQLQQDSPVHWSEAIQSWVVCRYQDVEAGLRNPHLSSRTAAAVLAEAVPELERGTVSMVSDLAVSLLNELDPPVHSRMRRLMSRALAAGASAERRPDVRGAARRLLDIVEPAGHMDLVADYACPLPAAVAADLLGVPESDRDDFARAVHDTVRTFSAGFAGGPAMSRGEEAVTWLLRYLQESLSRRRRDSHGGTMGALISAADCTEQERLLVAANIALGFQESVTQAITLLIRTLLEQPDVLSRVRAEPELLPAVVDEGFRYEGTAPILSRITTADTEIGGIAIPAAQPVVLLIAAANRDAGRFDHPHTFDPQRTGRHLAFGAGRHACPGAPFAREIVLVAVVSLLDRFTAIRGTGRSTQWREEINIHGLVRFPISFQPRRDSSRRPTRPTGGTATPAVGLR